MSGNDKAIVLVSGGMDSLVTAAIAAEKYQSLAFLHLNYRQRTEARELESFHKIADHYSVSPKMRKVVDISFLQDISGSSLVDAKMEVEEYSDTLNGEIPSTYVPFRNTHIIAIAVSWAEVIGSKFIYIGAVAEDSSGYPDCRPEYYKAMNQLIREGTKGGDIEVCTPIISMSKKEIVEKAMELKAPLEHSWSCYTSGDTACGNCASCGLRLKGFREAGIKDPLPYKSA